jgi:hypothetical protein
MGINTDTSTIMSLQYIGKFNYHMFKIQRQYLTDIDVVNFV